MTVVTQSDGGNVSRGLDSKVSTVSAASNQSQWTLRVGTSQLLRTVRHLDLKAAVVRSATGKDNFRCMK